jgi:hypothetical protein
MASLVLNGSTSGSVTLAAPAVSGTTTLTLPTTTGTFALTAAPTFTGQATIPTINLTGGQITFPATQSTSADANTLDDYEEGTWTPTYAGSTTNPTVTYASRQGTYTKIGNVVYWAISIITSAVSGGSGNLTVTGLPFALNIPGMSASTFAVGFTTASPNAVLPQGTSLLLYTTINSNVTVTPANLAATCYFYAGGFYYTT